jgi:phospholipase/carboxylesterase
MHLDGPRLMPAGEVRALVVLLHGYGANGDDLIELGRVWRAALPDTAFLAPHAPEPLAMMAEGRQWFPLTLRDPGEYWTGVSHAGPRLEAFLEAELARHHLAPDRLALVGFSQGTMMALHVGLRRAVPPAAIVGYSGVIAGPERLAVDIAARPPVLLVHGAADDVIPPAALHLTRESLAAAGVPVSWHLRPGLGHGIDAEGLAFGEAFLVRALRRG